MLAAVAFGVAVAPAAAADPIAVSVQSAADGGMEADRDSGSSDVSANGRYVAFESKAENLSPMAKDVLNVYLYDTERDTVELVSRKGSSGGNDKSQDPSISANGRYVAFASRAGNFPGPQQPNVYVYDARRDKLELVSRQSASAGDRAANSWSQGPQISADGQVIAFTTTASNLGGAIDARKNIYAYDRGTRTAELVSRSSGGAGGNAASLSAGGLSSDGRFVAFTSKATNLGGPDKGIFSGYVYDRRKELVRPVAPDAGARNSYLYVEAITGDGRRVAFYVNSGTFGSGHFVANIGDGHPRRLSRKIGEVDLSSDGRVAAASEQFHRRIDGVRVLSERVLHIDVRTGDRRVVSNSVIRPDGDDRASEAWEPSISADGRAISFTSGLSSRYGARNVPDLVFLSRR